MRRLDRQEHHPRAVNAWRRQRKAQRRAFPRKELMRDLNQDAGAVAGLRIAAAGAAMRQVDQDLQSLGDNVVGFLALGVNDEADATSVMLVSRVVETLLDRESAHVWSVA